jgi:hypothetical protein
LVALGHPPGTGVVVITVVLVVAMVVVDPTVVVPHPHCTGTRKFTCDATVTSTNPAKHCVPEPVNAIVATGTRGGAVSDMRLNSLPQLPEIAISFQDPVKYKSVCGGNSRKL